MSRTILTIVFLGICLIAYQQPLPALESSGKTADPQLRNRPTSTTTAFVYDGRKPSIGLRWVAGNERNRVVFTPAPCFLLVVGLSGFACLAIPLVRLARIA